MKKFFVKHCILIVSLLPLCLSLCCYDANGFETLKSSHLDILRHFAYFVVYLALHFALLVQYLYGLVFDFLEKRKQRKDNA